MDILTQYVTWKHAFLGLAALIASTGGILGYEASEHKDLVTIREYQTMQEDIKIIKACLIKKECG